MIELKQVLSSKEEFDRIFVKYYNKIIDDFSSRKDKISIKFSNGTVQKMSLNKFLVNLVFWTPFAVFKKEVTEEFIFKTENINADSIANYLDRIIDLFLTDDNQKEVNFVLSEIIKNLGYFSLDFNKRIGNTISLYDLINLSERVPRFNELINTRYNDNINTSEIEKDLSDKTKEMMGILGENENCLQDYINSKEGLNKNQLTQFLINIGPKPDLRGNVYPKIVDTNFITDGMKTPSDYFINSSGGRKAAITNHDKTKKSGYLMRKLSILCMNVDLDKDIKDCGSKNYIEVSLDSPETIKRYDKHYFYNEKKDKLILFKNNDKFKEKYLGKTLKFRSPITCACKNGKICKTCYGELSKINHDIHIGILAIEILTSQITQMLLSTKHLLKTSTKKINWNQHFMDLFLLNGNSLFLNQTVENISNYSLIFNEDNIYDNEEGFEDDEYDDENPLNEGQKVTISKYFRSCSIKYKENKKENIYTIDNGVDIYMSPYFEKYMKDNGVNNDGAIEVELKDLQKDKELFFIEIENDELSAILSNIIALIDKKERLGTKTYNEMINKFVELCNDSNIKINATHMEVILRELIKSDTNILERPDFSQPNPGYQILRLSDSIMNSNSVVTSLSFERVKEQLYKALTYKKNGSSLLDEFFK